MDHDIGPEAADQIIDDGGVDDVVLDEAQLRVLLQIVAPAGGEIVDRQHLVAARQQPVDDRGADEPRAAGDKNLHLIRSPSARIRV